MKMHPDELEIDVALVRRLVAAQFPDWAELPLEPVFPRGTDNRLFRLGAELVVRLPCREGTVKTLEKERDWLPWLAPHLPLDVPVPLAVGSPADGYPWTWSVYTWLEGESAISSPLEDPDAAATDLAAFIKALEGIDVPATRAPAKGTSRGAPVAGLDASVRESIAGLGREIEVARVTAVWEAALEASVWEQPPVWVHGDLDARNLLVRRGRIAAVVDFGCLGIGDPACDVAVAWKLFPPEARGRFREALSIDDATWARARGWIVYQSLGALAYYTLETNPSLFSEAQRWLRELLPTGPRRCA
ncbi:MAG TPA: aminoglycoside phosphotransferase family protein [Gaiellaceae bacterium]|nr:aminoglycoside phosphotransferase family protein [Gaiellaceae bacterium]